MFIIRLRICCTAVDNKYKITWAPTSCMRLIPSVCILRMVGVSTGPIDACSNNFLRFSSVTPDIVIKPFQLHCRCRLKSNRLPDNQIIYITLNTNGRQNKQLKNYRTRYLAWSKATLYKYLILENLKNHTNFKSQVNSR